MELDAQLVQLVSFDVKNNSVGLPNLRIDGTLRVGKEQLDLISEIKALKEDVAKLKAHAGP